MSGGGEPPRPAGGQAREMVVATSNPGKLREIRAILEDFSVSLVALDAFPEVRLPEEGDDYAENAVAKAMATAKACDRIALADDSGLEVDALGGRPGPQSARYGGPGLDDAGRVERLLRELDGVRDAERTARFVCIAALATPDGQTATARGICEGRITRSPRGERGFGYDPVFLVENGDRTMAELPPDRKNRLSHRARAFLALVPALRRHTQPA